MKKENEKPLFKLPRARKLALEFEKIVGDDKQKYKDPLFEVKILTKKLNDAQIVNHYSLKKLPHLDWITNKNLALSFYKTDLGYLVINNYLRQIKIEQFLENIMKKDEDEKYEENKEYVKTLNTLSDKVDKVIHLIDKSMNKKQSGTQVFRGLKQIPIFSPIDSGKIYKEMSYSSTSLDFCQSWKFMDQKSKCCVLSFKIPDNIKSIDYKDIGEGKDESGEDEILIQRYITYHIGESIIIGGVKFYSCVITPSKEDIKDVKYDLEKQLDYLRFFKSEYERIRGRNLEEIMEYYDKNKPNYLSRYVSIVNFDHYYRDLCLDNDFKDKVLSLLKVKYQNS